MRTCRIRTLTLLQAEGTQADASRDRCCQLHQCTTPHAAADAAADTALCLHTAADAAAAENSGLHRSVAAVAHQSAAAEAEAVAALDLRTAADDAAADNSGLHPSVAAVVHQSHTAGAATARHLHTVVLAAPPYRAAPPIAAYHHRRPSTSKCSSLTQYNPFSVLQARSHDVVFEYRSCRTRARVTREVYTMIVEE